MIYKGLKAYIEFICPTVLVIQSNQKAVLPKEYITMGVLSAERRGTNVHKYNHTDTLELQESLIVNVQVDCYGDNSLWLANTININFTDMVAVDYLKPFGISPLNTTTPRDMTFLNEGNQYEHRFMTELTFDVPYSYIHTQDFFDRAVLNKIIAVR